MGVFEQRSRQSGDRPGVSGHGRVDVGVGKPDQHEQVRELWCGVAICLQRFSDECGDDRIEELDVSGNACSS